MVNGNIELRWVRGERKDGDAIFIAVMRSATPLRRKLAVETASPRIIFSGVGLRSSKIEVGSNPHPAETYELS
jgi:hypothetical protein